MTDRMWAILEAMDKNGHTSWTTAETPNGIGYSVGVQPRGGAQYRSRGPGSIIAQQLTMLKRERLIAHAGRPDGLSGTAYYITERGQAAIATIDLNRRYDEEWLGNMRARFMKELRLDVPVAP